MRRNRTRILISMGAVIERKMKTFHGKFLNNSEFE
jgi:hypothetical protein